MKNLNNYQLFIEQLKQIKSSNPKPSLLLHSCCGPCSSYVLNFLNEYFTITILYYNPNIFPHEEFIKRLDEQKKVINIINPNISIIVIDEDYQVYCDKIGDLGNLGERSIRCYNCYKFRLEKLAKIAMENKFNYFTTTLSISPYKNSEWINEIGNQLTSTNCTYLYSNFKKDSGYLKSIAFCKEYNIYRQDYCGCSYSKEEYERKKL